MNKNILNLYKKCLLCPRGCRVDRTRNQLGFCKATSDIIIASYMPHRFEEPAISGDSGSGTIFFCHCTGMCSYCQNFNFSRGKCGKPVSTKRLSEIMLELQAKKCHNINLVTPTHYVPSIITAIDMARQSGLEIPIVYNTNGYESEQTIIALKGYIDIYMPDAKYSDNALAKEHCCFIDYSQYNIAAIKRMYEQVGNLSINEKGIAVKGLLIRHLVLPGYMENTKGVFDLISRELGNNIYISLMSQYSPIACVRKDINLGRRLNKAEYNESKEYIESLGFVNGWTQDFFNE
jgi:putative pyruvate formate lyase activating enzyme